MAARISELRLCTSCKNQNISSECIFFSELSPKHHAVSAFLHNVAKELQSVLLLWRGLGRMQPLNNRLFVLLSDSDFFFCWTLSNMDFCQKPFLGVDGRTASGRLIAKQMRTQSPRVGKECGLFVWLQKFSQGVKEKF